MIASTKQTCIESKQLVILVHGFLSKRLLMKPLEWQIARLGFRTQRWGYPSYYGSLQDHASKLRPVLEKAGREHECIHVVAHSMGTIVFRLAMEYGPLDNLGRVVLMAPPNQGIRVARLVGPGIGKFCKAVSELSDDPGSLVNRIQSQPLLDVGVVSGRFDWVVRDCDTRLAEQRDHVCLNATHNSMLVQPSAARQVAEFLTTGHFQHTGLSDPIAP